MKKTILIWIFVILLISISVDATFLDKTDFANIINSQEWMTWDWKNITLLYKPEENITTFGYNWSASYTGESTLPSSFANNGSTILTNGSFIFNANKINASIGHGINYSTQIADQYYALVFRDQSPANNAWVELDNGVCTDNYLGVAKELQANKFSGGGSCGSIVTSFTNTVNRSEYYSIVLDANKGLAFLSNGSIQDSHLFTPGLTYSQFLWTLTGGNSSLGYIRLYSQTTAIQNISANRWQKKIYESIPGKDFKFNWLGSSGDTSTDANAFVSCNNGTTWQSTNVNNSIVSCPSLSQDIIYGFNLTGSNINISRININDITYPLTFCNSSTLYTVNYSIRDEQTNALLQSSINSVLTYNSSVSTTNILSTSQTSTNLSVCIDSDYYNILSNEVITYSSSGYQQRSSNTQRILTQNTQSVTFYLLSSTNGISVRFQIFDQLSNPIQGAIATAYLTGTSTIVESETSDSSGLVTFFLNPNQQYDFTFIKSGYTTNTQSLRITDGNLRTITLSSPTKNPTTSQGAGISYIFSPQTGTLNNNTAYDFAFNLTSTYWNLTNCVLYLRNSTDVFTSSSGTFNGSQCSITINFYTANNSNMYSLAVYQLNGTNQSLQNYYVIQYSYKGVFSLKVAIDDISNFGGAGFNGFDRALIAFIVTFLIVGAIALEAIREPEPLLLVAWSLTTLFSYVGWYTVPFNLPSVWLNQYLVFVFMTLLTAGFIINRLA